MKKKILIVDDNLEVLRSLKESLEDHDEHFSVITARDGFQAIKMLKENPISLVVTDLKMPQMNGATLRAYIVEHFPDIPVFIMTGYGKESLKRQIQMEDALEYIEKPIVISDLTRKIKMILQRESEGGILHDISSGMFLQLMDMERKTCTIRLNDKQSGKHGVLFVKEGALIDARVGSIQGTVAAYEILSWDEANLSIQNACFNKKKRIENDLQAVLLEAMRLKDEREQREEPGAPSNEDENPDELVKNGGTEDTNPTDYIKCKLDAKMDKKWELENIYQDNSWNSFMAQIRKMGAIFDAGRLNLAYIDRGESNDFILLPGQETTVISISPKCPKEKIIQIINDTFA
ncbi:MAG: response regulator [Thermodesulfobacteriota bacterium]|nr:response regulator [Thermodesulfobacteriota bacterium]